MTTPVFVSETGARVNAVAEWRSPLAALAGATLLFETLSGLALFLWPEARANELGAVVHTGAGLALAAPVGWYLVRHWIARRVGGISHVKLLGYFALVLLVLCAVSGLVVTWQATIGPRVDPLFSQVHLVTGVGTAVFLAVHLVTVILKPVANAEALVALRAARGVFWRRTLVGAALLTAAWAGWSFAVHRPEPRASFPSDYNWRFGEDRPFAPSLARIDLGDGEAISVRDHGAMDPAVLAGSARCGTAGCHEQIYHEWLPSAHRYASLDSLFQRVQELMAVETSPEHTRYCAGCHDPISLFSGSKNSGNVTLSALGADEGVSCLVCHSIVQTDVQGNGDYTIRPPRRAAYETDEGPAARVLSDFIIRALPAAHVEAYSRPLYKTAEFCAACHKQYIDREVNTDIGKVQGQNQYDSWRTSRWNVAEDPSRTVTCRECHLPLQASRDPARGDRVDPNRTSDDARHRGHAMAGSNQYVPLLHGLEHAEAHTDLITRWLRGEVAVPEIADRWTEGPVVRMALETPPAAKPGDEVRIQVVLTNNKAGHDFPTGPLDMIESWLEVIVEDQTGRRLFESGTLAAQDAVAESPVWLKSDPFDRKGQPIDRHNLWDLVGAKYKRALFPGATDTVDVRFECPASGRGRVTPEGAAAGAGQRIEEISFRADPDSAGALAVTARLLYRKANPRFLDRVFGIDSGVRAPITELARATASIPLSAD